jgi:hypothetical protein
MVVDKKSKRNPSSAERKAGAKKKIFPWIIFLSF